MTDQPRRLIKLPEVCSAVALRPTAIYQRIKDGTFPAPIKLGRTSGWIEAEVQEWISAQIAASRDAT
ncbi:helix-turn-helix transcriptional regulator [Cupriavidus sp. H18C2]|uniref:helix-turn-helix transcriptional regulator n=1 Tax=Cupriavidus sp. H18C2 TaxID=3241602 RepID=UPI003BF8AEBB